MNEKRLNEILARMGEIAKEIDGADENRIAELTREVDALKAEEAQIRSRLDLAGKIGAAVTGTERSAEDRMMQVRSSRAYAEAYCEYIKKDDASQCRALLSENAANNGQVPVPTLVDDVVRHAWDREGLMKRIKKSYLKGNIKIGYEISGDDAHDHAEGTDQPNEENLYLGIVTMIPGNIKKWITISDEVMDLTGEAFLQYVYEELAYKIAKKAAANLITKIKNCGTTPTTSDPGVPVITVTTASIGTVAKAIALLSDEAVDPVAIMNKQTWGDFKEVQYTNKYNVDPFEGLDVEFNNTITAYSAATSGETYMIVGDLGNGAQANFPNGEEIKLIIDEKSLAEKDLVKIVGREYVAIEVVAPKQFVQIKK